MRRLSSSLPTPRRGFVLVLVLLVLLIAGGLLLQLLQSALQQRRQAHEEQDWRQARQLLLAAMQDTRRQLSSGTAPADRVQTVIVHETTGQRPGQIHSQADDLGVLLSVRFPANAPTPLQISGKVSK